MGCGNAKEKLEDELMKAKMERIEIQFERQKQMNLLKDLGGDFQYKPPVIPDYIIKGSKEPTIRQRKIIQSSKHKTERIRPNKRSKSLAIKKKMSINGEEISSEHNTKRNKNLKRRTMKV